MASPKQLSSMVGDGRKGSSYSYSGFVNDPRNTRLDTLINAQSQPPSNPSVFDTTSPVSLDYNFGFGGSPHDSSNSGIDAPPDLRMAQSQGFPARSSMTMTGVVPKLSSQQHRASLASIDSAFDQDLATSGNAQQWTPSNSANHAISNPDDSPRRTDNDAKSRKDDDDGDRPAWSELKTKAGKERKRLPLACIACRRKKIRCSGEKPACKHCLRARVPCVYKVTTRKAAPRTDYMAMLDKRLKRMEDRVIKAIPKEELPDLSQTGRASVRPPLPGQTLPIHKKDKSVPGKKRSADEAFTKELTDWTQSRQRVAFLDQESGVRKQRDGEHKLFIEGSESLPPQHIQEHLAEVFFDCVYGQSYLLLHKPSFMRKLKAGTVPPVLILAVCAISARFSTHPQVSTEPAFLRGEQWATPARRIIEKRHYEPNITILIAMLMLGLHYFGTCEGGLSWSFGGQAMRMGYALQLHRELDHDPLGRHQIIGTKSTPANNPSRPSSSAASKPPELSFTDREIRRRTMWACYLMDTFNSSGTERPSFLNEDYFQIQLPISEENFLMETPGPTEDLTGNIPLSPQTRTTTNPSTLGPDHDTLASTAKSNMGVAAYIVRCVVLWKRIVKYLNLGGKDLDPKPIWDPLSQFSTLSRSITTLRTSLPSHLTYTPTNLATHSSLRLANQFLFLHIVLSQSTLFLHRFAIPSHPSSRPSTHLSSGMPRSFLSTSATTVLDSASTISLIISASSGHTLTVPFAGYCAYAAATVHVWGIFSHNDDLISRSKDNLRHNYKYLTRMKRYWGMFHYMAESVKDTYRAFADSSMRSGGAGLGAQTQQTLLLRTRGAGGGTTTGAGGAGENKDGSGAANSTNGNNSPLELSRAGTPSHSANNSASSGAGPPGGKQMFQYGDWFDKYPHGVSESEWESSHLEYRKDGDKGSEAVMSQRSDLQSVEEFFASLSPPSKADDAVGGGGGGGAGGRKKVPRRRGKSVAENKTEGKNGGKNDGNGNGNGNGQSQGSGKQQQRSSVSGAERPQLGRRHSGSNTSRHHQQPMIDLPAFPTDFDMTSPSIYHTPQIPQSANSDTFFNSSANQMPYNYTSAVPHLDRQMVFGAYAGLDPSTISSDTINHDAFSQNTSNPWGDVDVNGYNFNDSFGGNGMGGGSAWFTPFNMEPPNFGINDDLSGTGLDGMDFGDFSSMANDGARGSFSTQEQG